MQGKEKRGLHQKKEGKKTALLCVGMLMTPLLCMYSTREGWIADGGWTRRLAFWAHQQ
jgi:hypothetical protein